MKGKLRILAGCAGLAAVLPELLDMGTGKPQAIPALGENFPMIRWMERGEGYIGDENKTNNKQYAYPYLMQSADGRLHLTYAAFTRKAVKYVSFTEADVMGAKRERYGVYNSTSGEGARDANKIH